MRWKLGVLAGLAAALVLGLLASAPAWSGQDEQPSRRVVMNQCALGPVYFAVSALDLDGDGEVTQEDLSLLGARIGMLPPGSPPVDVAGVPEGDLAERLAGLGGDDSLAMDKLRGIYDGLVACGGAREKRRSLQAMHDYMRILELGRRLIGEVLKAPEDGQPVAGVLLLYWDGRHQSSARVMTNGSEELDHILAGRAVFHHDPRDYQTWVMAYPVVAARVVE